MSGTARFRSDPVRDVLEENKREIAQLIVPDRMWGFLENADIVPIQARNKIMASVICLFMIFH